MNCFYYFEAVPGKDEYYITHKQCGICKLTNQEHCEEITNYTSIAFGYLLLDVRVTLDWEANNLPAVYM